MKIRVCSFADTKDCSIYLNIVAFLREVGGGFGQSQLGVVSGNRPAPRTKMCVKCVCGGGGGQTRRISYLCNVF